MTKSAKPKAADAGELAPFEDLLSEVEQRLKALEDGELSLDDSLKAYEAGVKALRGCYAHLKAAEGRIEVLSTTATEPEVRDFEIESGQGTGKARKVDARKRPTAGGEGAAASAKVEENTDGEDDGSLF